MKKGVSLKSLAFQDSGLSRSEWRVLEKLSTPEKIQDYLNNLPFNFEEKGETCMSVGRTIRSGRAHCFEGALLAASALWLQGEKPLLLDLKTTPDDDEHVVALFRRGSKWGAISKTNHSVLRYRDPVYRDVRELAMSYFHEYFLNDGAKTLRSFSEPFDLSVLGLSWLSTEEDLFWLSGRLDRTRHIKILDQKQAKSLRKAEKIEIQASNHTEYKPRRQRK